MRAGTALSPLPAGYGAVSVPSAIVVPYWKKKVVVCLFGSTDPRSRTLWNVSFAGVPVVAAGFAASAAAGITIPTTTALSSAPNHLLRICMVLPDVDVLTPTSSATRGIPR